MSVSSRARPGNAAAVLRAAAWHHRAVIGTPFIPPRIPIASRVNECWMAGVLVCALMLAACGATARPPTRTNARAAGATAHARLSRSRRTATSSSTRPAPTPAATIPCPGDPQLTVNRFTSCPFARNVLDAYTTSPTAEMSLAAGAVLVAMVRTVIAPSPVTGRTYRMRCALNTHNGAEGNGPLTVTCTGGDRAEVLFPVRFTYSTAGPANAVAADPYCEDGYCGYNRPWFQSCQPGYQPRGRTFCLAGPAAVRRMAAPAGKRCGAGVVAGSGVLCGAALEAMSEYRVTGWPGCKPVSSREVRCSSPQDLEGGTITFPLLR